MPENVRSAIIGIEFLVENLDDSIAVFVDGLGWELVDRQAASDVAGERAVVVAPGGSAPAVTLFRAADRGPGVIVPDRTPRLTQVVVGADRSSDVADRLADLGLAVEEVGDHVHVDPAAMAGVWGATASLIVTEIS